MAGTSYNGESSQDLRFASEQAGPGAPLRAEPPILYFDDIPAVGMAPGMGRLILTAQVHEVAPDGSVQLRSVVVAHLRGSEAAFGNLRRAIDQMTLLGAPGGQTAN